MIIKEMTLSEIEIELESLKEKFPLYAPGARWHLICRINDLMDAKSERIG